MFFYIFKEVKKYLVCSSIHHIYTTLKPYTVQALLQGYNRGKGVTVYKLDINFVVIHEI